MVPCGVSGFTHMSSLAEPTWDRLFSFGVSCSGQDPKDRWRGVLCPIVSCVHRMFRS